MKTHATFFLFVVIVAGSFLGCATGSGAKSQPQPSVAEQAKATGQAPVAAQVEEVRIPADPNLPRYVIAIKPFDYSASGQQSGGGQAAPAGTPIVESDAVTSVSGDGNEIVTRVSASAGPNIGKGIAAQLRTALSGWPNITIVPLDAVNKKSDGTYSCKMQPGEIGPFILEGTVTEFSETADASGKGGGVNLRKVGWGLGLIGGLTGNRGLAVGGVAGGVLGPEFKNANMKRTGMVGMDLGLLDGRIARYVGGGTFACQGSFSTVTKASNFSMFAVSTGKSEMAASSLGNATRAALNDALQKTHAALAVVTR